MSESEQHIKRAHRRSLERALREERLALAAISKVFVLECPDPGRLLARLEAMLRAAQQNPGTTVEVKQALIDGVVLIRNAIAREMGRPQTLLDPPGWDPGGGHVKPKAVDALVPGSISQQLGLVEGDNSGPLADVINIQQEQTKTITAIHDHLVKALREGPATDKELYTRFILNPATPPQSYEAIVERRKELTLSGRVKDSGGRQGKTVIWTLVEGKAVAAVTEKKKWKRGGGEVERIQCPECGEWFGKGAGIGTHLKTKHNYSVGQRRAVAASN